MALSNSLLSVACDSAMTLAMNFAALSYTINLRACLLLGGTLYDATGGRGRFAVGITTVSQKLRGIPQ